MVDCENPKLVGEENETLFISVEGKPQRENQKGQYLLVVGLDCYNRHSCLFSISTLSIIHNTRNTRKGFAKSLRNNVHFNVVFIRLQKKFLGIEHEPIVKEKVLNLVS